MIRKARLVIFFLIFVLSINCSFDNKTGIWSGGEEEKERIANLEKEQKSILKVIKIYSSENVYEKEISSNKSINLSIPKKNLSWKTSNLNLQNFTGNIYFTGINRNFLKKKIGKNKFRLSKITSSPLVYNDTIIASDDTGSIFSLSLQGKINWKRNIYKKIYKKIYKNLSFSIYEDKIYVTDNVGFIYSISLNTGEILWLKNHGIPLKSNVKIFKSKIFVINQDNRILCFDIKDGSLIWDIRAIPSFIKSQNFLALAISKEGDLVTLNSAGDLLKAKSANGKMYWYLNATGSLLAHDTDFFESSQIVLSGNDIIFSTSSSTYSYNLSNGSLQWVKDINSSNTPVIDGNNIFLISSNGYLINLDRGSGKIISSTYILKVLKKKKRITRVTGFIMGSGKIYATTLNGYLIVCSAASGNIEYFKKIAGTITAAPIISNGALYILTEKSKILGFN